MESPQVEERTSVSPANRSVHLVFMGKHTRFLGIYVSAAALAHLCLYVVLNLFSDTLGWLFYFDTRIGFHFIETVVKHSEGTPPALTAWLIEIGLLALGIGMFTGKNLVRIYVIIESILTIPYLLFFLLVLAVGMSANHGFSPTELLIPSAVVVLASVLPLVYAIWILWRFRSKNSLSIAQPPSDEIANP